MKLLEFLFSKSDSGKEIGSHETTPQELVAAFTQLASRVGITNPGHIAAQAAKSIRLVRKKNGNFILTLLAFDPPVEVEWSPKTPLNALYQTLNSLASSGKHVSYFSTLHLQDGQRFFQIATH